MVGGAALSGAIAKVASVRSAVRTLEAIRLA
jgi:hypothetical protein